MRIQRSRSSSKTLQKGSDYNGTITRSKSKQIQDQVRALMLQFNQEGGVAVTPKLLHDCYGNYFQLSHYHCNNVPNTLCYN